MNRPGGNATGVIYFISTLVVKRLEMLRELVPQASLIGFLTNPTNSSVVSLIGIGIIR
jgi:putative ABC transport system substrate-binding protein